MNYVKVNNVSYEEAIKVINCTLENQGISSGDLVKRIGYPFERKGMEEIELFLSGGHPKEGRVREKIGNALNIDRELLFGERGFENFEDAARFSFYPYLIRVPEETRPSQITIFGLVGFERVFVAGRFRNLLNKPLAEQLEYVRNEILNDTEHKGSVMLFGKKLGYAFYWDFEQPAVALSVAGELMEDTFVTYDGFSSCTVSVKAKTIIETSGCHHR
jgi:hypothetical protein